MFFLPRAQAAGEDGGGLKMDWHLPLVIAAAVFLAFIVLRFRPVLGALGGDASREARAALKSAKKRLDAAKTDNERVDALVDAGDASAKLVSGGGRAVSYYLRAMKLSPVSVELVERVARGMARRPRGLENVLWRRLGTEEWTADEAHVLAAILKNLSTLYGGPLKSSVRARAFTNMMKVVASKPRTVPPGALPGERDDAGSAS